MLVTPNRPLKVHIFEELLVLRQALWEEGLVRTVQLTIRHVLVLPARHLIKFYRGQVLRLVLRLIFKEVLALQEGLLLQIIKHFTPLLPISYFGHNFVKVGCMAHSPPPLLAQLRPLFAHGL